MKNKIFIYTAITYAITWSIAFVLYGLFRGGQISEFQLNLWHSLAGLGPTVGALITVHYFYGRQGVSQLVQRLKYGHIGRTTLLFVVSPVILFGIGIIVFRFVQGEWYSFAAFSETSLQSGKMIAVWILPLITYPVFEEIGWRGFLLPHLQERYTAWIATIWLAAVWALWHIPFFFYRYHLSLGMSIGFFFGLFVGAVILTSIYNSSQGMLIPVMLFHFLNNICSAFDKEIIVAVVSTGLIFVAIYIFIKFGKESLSHRVRIGNYFLEKTALDQTLR